MNKIKSIIFSLVLLFVVGFSHAQTLNWASLNTKQKHIVNLNAGIDYGLVFGAGYEFQLNTKLPILLNAELSVPSGKNLTDDFKTKIGGEIRWFHSGNFYVSSDIQGIFRKYENSYATLLNFGSYTSAIAGYYRPKWFVAGELGFDKAIVTHFKHTDLFKENFPGIKDGWYEPATGGNFNYGIQGGTTIKRTDIYLKLGKTIQQDFKTNPVVPFYFQIGVNEKFGKRK